MTQPKYDWLKAVRARPEDAAIQLEHYYVLEGRRTFALDRLAEAARVQSVAEADRAYVDWILDSGAGYMTELVNACREARAREAEGEGEGQ